MSLWTYIDTELHKLAEPIWINIINGSNQINYKLFSASFSEGLKQKVTEEHFHSQCKEFSLLTSLTKDVTFIGCMRRESGTTILWRQKSPKLAGEFLGQVTLQEENGGISVIEVSIY